MTTTITHASGTIAAYMSSFEGDTPLRSIVHTIIGRPDPDITKRPSGLRKGTLKLVFETGAAAVAARAVLAVTQPLTLSNSGVDEVSMQFVVAGGDLGQVLSSGGVWSLEVPYQEIS
ncbi:hypothetical protein [Microbacterium oxydans]|uniref:hypothetical protein n=1 Tax=Microbacterium oxydans TaxID=82380 RepID=UPI0036735FB3